MEGRLFDKPLNPNKLLKEQFVSNLTGSSLLEIAALSTIVPALVVLRKWSSGDNSSRDSAKKNDDQVHPVRKDWMQYFSTLALDYLTVVLPILLVFTVLAEWAYTCAISLVILISIYIVFKRSRSHDKAGLSQLPSLWADVSSYRVSVVLVTCLCILAVDFKIFPRRYAKAETYDSGIMDLGVGSFVVANALVSRQARNITSIFRERAEQPLIEEPDDQEPEGQQEENQQAAPDFAIEEANPSEEGIGGVWIIS